MLLLQDGSRFESYEKRKASREQEPVLAVTMAKRVKGTSGNAITKGGIIRGDRCDVWWQL